MIDIRKGIKADAETIAAFQVTMARETEDLVLDLATVVKGVNKILDEPDRGYYLIAESEGEIIASLLVLYEWSDWRNGDVLWIHSLFVVEAHRGKGIFRKMYDKLQKFVDENESYKGIRLYVEKTNEKAQKVYNAIGMTKEHYDMYEWLK
ncbi:GNAT family N-acetyltransferase [Chondrinema litorale]|uniref:GNAT family N-acetyltransferase n=1 Tax=Chondrinema litorale TaxID=2994555 RepID=UPI002543B7AD|nr:GNAT family N-acetyltransferase [Chondrinema litorale]UZR94310.1 GNAT family N-acetyltransferase [Chondrinema litorale]